jgi:hypothetical protein
MLRGVMGGRGMAQRMENLRGDALRRFALRCDGYGRDGHSSQSFLRTIPPAHSSLSFLAIIPPAYSSRTYHNTI